MYSQSSTLEDDLTCPVCCDIFTDPVLLLCSHSVCRACLQQFWSIHGFQECPICRKRFTGCTPISNLALRNLCESVLQERNKETTSSASTSSASASSASASSASSASSLSGSEMICTVHNERLKLFCLDDRHAVCLVCRDSETHLNHIFRPVEEAVPLLKDGLKTELNCLQAQLRSYQEMRQTFGDTAQHIKIQAQDTVRRICEDFDKLHRFLQDEQMLRVSALTEEEHQKSEIMKTKIEMIEQEIQSLSQTILNIQDDLATGDMSFLQRFSLSVERGQNTQPSPEMPSGALINVAEHLGNLKFKVLEKMKDVIQCSPVILDPNTANPLLVLSGDLTSVEYSNDSQNLPDNPERFDNYYCVLGSEGFNSGIHRWDVEVGDNTCWSVGVTTESNQRKGEDFFKAGVWRVRYMEGQYTSQSPLQARRLLAVKRTLHTITIQLDFNRGNVLFCDPETNTILLTFTTTFTERIFPFLYNCCTRFPLKILPVKFSVKVEDPS